MRTQNQTKAAAARNRKSAAAKKRFPKLMRRRDAPRYLLEIHGLQYAADTLAKFACEGIGAEMTYVNDIPFYTPAALDAWAKLKTSKPTRQARKYPQPRDPRLRRAGQGAASQRSTGVIVSPTGKGGKITASKRRLIRHVEGITRGCAVDERESARTDPLPAE